MRGGCARCAPASPWPSERGRFSTCCAGYCARRSAWNSGSTPRISWVANTRCSSRASAPGSPAQHAGLLPGDLIVRIDGEPLADAESQALAWSRHQPGDRVRLTVERPGRASPLVLTGTFRVASGSGESYLANECAELAARSVRADRSRGAVSPARRREHLAAGAAARELHHDPERSAERLRGGAPILRVLANAYKALFVALVGPLFYWFFARFPARSPIDRRVPWLKWLSVALGLCLALPGRRRRPVAPAWPAAGDAARSRSEQPPFLVRVLLPGSRARLAGPEFLLGPATASPDTADGSMVWGAIVGLVPQARPLAAEHVCRTAGARGAEHVERRAGVSGAFPTVIRLRGREAPGARHPGAAGEASAYLLVQRGFALSLSLVSIALTLLFAFSSRRQLQPVIQVAGPSGIVLGAVFGTVVLWGGLRVHRQVSGRIDRAFFRSAYDARVILEDLADQTRAARTRDDMAALLERHLSEALSPASLVVYLAAATMVWCRRGRGPPGRPDRSSVRPSDPQRACRGWRAAGIAAPTPTDSGRGSNRRAQCRVPGSRGRTRSSPGRPARPGPAAFRGTVLRRGQAAAGIGRQPGGNRARQHPLCRRGWPVETKPNADWPAKWRSHAVVQRSRCCRDRRRRSERRSVTRSASRRARWAAITTSWPWATTAWAWCSPTSPEKASMLRGLPAFRPICAARRPWRPWTRCGCLARPGEPGILFTTSTARRHFRHLFFGVYDDCSRRMTYVNCGRDPPAAPAARRQHREALGHRAVVSAYFEEWECHACELQLAPGDLLAIFSDGITEATHRGARSSARRACSTSCGASRIGPPARWRRQRARRGAGVERRAAMRRSDVADAARV